MSRRMRDFDAIHDNHDFMRAAKASEQPEAATPTRRPHAVAHWRRTHKFTYQLRLRGHAIARIDFYDKIYRARYGIGLHFFERQFVTLNGARRWIEQQAAKSDVNIAALRKST